MGWTANWATPYVLVGEIIKIASGLKDLFDWRKAYSRFWWCWYFVFFVGNPTYLKSTFGQSIHGQSISTIQKYHQDLDPQILLAFVKVLWDLTRTIFLSYSQLIEIWEIFDLLSVGFWIEIATLRKNANTATRIILFWMSKPLCYRMPGSFKFAWSRKSW